MIIMGVYLGMVLKPDINIYLNQCMNERTLWEQIYLSGFHLLKYRRLDSLVV